MKKRIITAVIIVCLAALVFAPMYYQTIAGQRTWYSLYDGIETNIAENQWFWPSWN